ncbi:MAG: lysophospholipid acyltransferase family protein [Gemmataceae bacterium]
MKIRHPFLIKLVSLLGAWLIRLWIGTLPRKQRSHTDVDLRRHDLPRNYIYVLWHEDMLLAAYHFRGANISILISHHADGEMIARICEALKLKTVRGSTGANKGGTKALRELIAAGKAGHLAVTPDGPRGPRRSVEMGAIFLASKTGMPIVPMGYGYRKPWRAKSWDRMALPKPWSPATCILGDPIEVPRKLERDQLEEYRLRVEQALGEVSARADAWANGVEPEALDKQDGLGEEQRRAG